ncbi:TetR/AcrR family transcriptional regulator [Radiobacillus deserti]|uniref:TetR/AcrR family transcriptional regulator n=1 Tax=Radiobacillus deserti TaxID=2594883 RepID=UPI001315310A|nr:TetR/AcrR family transcriptional regulator [Radiobacillus deserti]
MKDKRLKIMEAAMHLFSSKGYFSTSVQEIAEYCGVSKGSVYTFFDSKEALLLEVFQYNHEKMMDRARSVILNQSISPEERFEKMIIVELEGLKDNKDFFNTISRSLPGNNQIRLFMKNIRRTMVNWHKHILEDIFGDEVRPNIWDVTFMFQGIMKEYTHLITQEQKPLSLSEVAHAIYESVDAIVQKRKRKEPVIPLKVMDEYEASPNPFSFDEKETVEEFIQRLKRKLHHFKMDNTEKEELMDSIQLLVEEDQREHPRMFLIKAILTHLSGYSDIKPEVENLRLMLVKETNKKGMRTHDK